MAGVDDVTDATVKEAFGARLRELRGHADLTRPQFAERVGKSPEAIRDIEIGKNSVRLPDAARFAAALGVSLPELTDLADLPRHDSEHRSALLAFVRTARAADAASIHLMRSYLRGLLAFLNAREG
ncbi:Transcriptional regulator, contains XRE-family HTH domain [Limimonas halophila]|uniref:Transcriptional regulator, contains XRE-family HTH domain n=1 Tax=Limimonas halophila TaxID=1082479 RepID=A0A1G7QJF1_9PROT|nr:helix-turn-helix transcriptional regulator [Limimonas halophila]SDF98661.1 Transcriptional regulator, contains XRE-family HTH domain [Limimonas halophila]